MLLYSVAVITLVATSIATQPSGYIKQPGNDKNSQDYQYNYKAGDDESKSEEKIEARSGDRYYVSSDQSSADVKYFADELGYHPLAKYRFSNENSAAEAALSIGVDVLGASVTSPKQQNIQPVQLIQPYTLHQEVDETSQIVKHDQSILADNGDVKPRSLLESNISEESRNINYVNLPQRQTFQVISSNGIPSGDGSTSSHSTTLPVIVQSAVTPVQTSPADVSYVSDSGDNKNDLLSEISEEQLFVENAGSFGQRLGIPASVSHEKDSSYSSTTAATQSKKNSQNSHNLARNRYPSKLSTKKNRKIQGVRLYNVGFSGHVDLATQESPRDLNAFPSTTFSPIVTTAIDQYSSLLPTFINAIETSQKTVYSPTEYPKESEIGLSNPQQINYALLASEASQFKSFGLSAPANENSTLQVDRNSNTNWVTPHPKTTHGFSKPIVVPEIPFEYSTTFECDDSIPSSTPNTLHNTNLRSLGSSKIVPTSKADNNGYISSLILNPIQAGVALVNAGKEHLISRTFNNLPFVEKKVDKNLALNDEESKIYPLRIIFEKTDKSGMENSRTDNSGTGNSRTDNSGSGNSRTDNSGTGNSRTDNSGSGNSRTDNSEKENSRTDKSGTDNSQTKETEKSPKDEGIEIQKSIEIYHNAPVQEIHYPPQMFSQVIHIDQLRGGQRYIAENVQNAKQVQRSDATNAPYEINHEAAANINQNIPEDKNPQSHVFAINQEFEDESGMNSIFQSGGQRYYQIYPKLQESRDLKGSVESKDVRHSDSATRTESQVDEASFQSYRSQDNRASYSSDINHAQQQIAVAMPLGIVQVQSEPRDYQAPYQLRDYEIPSYQIDLEKSLQQTIEFELNQANQPNFDIQLQQLKKLGEKPFEKKNPLDKKLDKKAPEKSIIPHPYPVHIQIPVERIIEKRVPIPQLFPIPVEKMIEKKIPIQKIVPQLIPVPVKVPQPFAIEKVVVEKHIPIPVEKIIEKKVPQPYPVEIEKIVERKIPIPVEVTKYLEKPVPIQVPYGVQYGVSYQQIMKPQNHNLYSASASVPLYGLSIIKNQQVYNYTQPHQGHLYPKPFLLDGKSPNTYFVGKNLNPGKKQFMSHFTFAAQPSIMQGYSIYNPSHRRRHTLHRMSTKEKAEKDGYFGPVPSGLPHHNQGQQHGFQSKTSNFHSTSATRSPSLVTTLRKVKQADHYHPVGKGSFRQSKMEYGFKPPMIPSVQYDEKTATKVES